jgi:hypothetical protein
VLHARQRRLGGGEGALGSGLSGTHRRQLLPQRVVGVCARHSGVVAHTLQPRLDVPQLRLRRGNVALSCI